MHSYEKKTIVKDFKEISKGTGTVGNRVKIDKGNNCSCSSAKYSLF